jgi:uncharacterized protein (TIGR02996 family)
MSEEAAFLRAIQANQADTTAKLVYADWLDEHGEPERAEYLRVLANGETDHNILYDLATRAGSTWAGWVRYPKPPAAPEMPTWDEATLYAIGSLDGTLEAYRHFNERVSDLDFDFRASLVPNTDSIESLCRTHCVSGRGTLTVEPLADWAAELSDILRAWLFIERGSTRAHSSLKIETEEGRMNAVHDVIANVRNVLRPRRGWRMLFEPEGFYALDWADIALETADRVLFMHFSVTD